MDPKAMFNIGYGLYVLTAREGEKDNGCIINTLQQAASTPNTISISVNKQNYTHDMIMRTGCFNVSMLDESVPFEVFKHFGFQSGRDTDKIVSEGAVRGENGICYINGCTNAYLGGKVFQTIDLGSHTMFLASVTEGEVLSKNPSVTYAYYHANIKPKPQPAKVKGWRCKICGYVYEGEELPADFICPLCKHPASDFEPIMP
ncbi:MAG: flavin reductase [Oscillospiraceae bacterium]